jgi:hypothetical protein
VVPADPAALRAEGPIFLNNRSWMTAKIQRTSIPQTNQASSQPAALNRPA